MLAHKHLFWWCISACASQAVRGLALPALQAPRSNGIVSRDGIEARGKGFANGMALRIMPLGASITYGYGSKDKDGYRKDLRDKLEAGGNEVNMVGDNPSGEMKDNDTEGWKGYTVAMVHEKANKAVPEFKPNLILVNVGTNDCIKNEDLPDAGNRMTSLLNDLYRESPRATVILSTLLVNRDDAVQKRTVDFNDQLKTVASKFQLYGKRLVLVDMQGPKGPLKADLNADGTHPNEVGYRKMADVWYDGIQQADSRKYLQEAEAVKGIAPDGA
ncbi:carbohydrate esterase family 3 protein [Hypoxylon sp. FL1150]|nr:carbohydrate esterase family 3 protein [Hypoxylon sp. FL1150]